MKRCNACHTVSVAPGEGEMEYPACRLCGGIDFIDISEEELQKVLKQLARRERCCPNPRCEPLLLTNEERFCSKCGAASEKSTLDLWIRKCVEPHLGKKPERIFLDLSPFIESGRKMGFSSDSATGKLNEKFRLWTGWSYDVIADWISRIRNILDTRSSDDRAGMNASKKLYKNSPSGDDAVGIILKLVKGTAAEKINEEISFTEHIKGEYIGFSTGANKKELWVFPIPDLEFSENTFGAVFNLTAENYKSGNIKPRKVVFFDANNPGIWATVPFIESQRQLIETLIAEAEKKGINLGFCRLILTRIFADHAAK